MYSKSLLDYSKFVYKKNKNDINYRIGVRRTPFSNSIYMYEKAACKMLVKLTSFFLDTFRIYVQKMPAKNVGEIDTQSIQFERRVGFLEVET